MTGGLGFWGEAALNNLAAWFVTYLLYSTLLLGAVALGSRWRVVSLETENALWRAVLLLAPLAATVRIAIEHTGESAVIVGPDAIAVAGRAGSVLVATMAIAAGVATLLVGRWGGSAAREWSRLSDRRPTTDRESLALVRELAKEAGVRVPRLTESHSIGGPVAIGRREICLPAEGFAEIDLPLRRAVLAHELGHIARRDSVWTTFARLLERVFFVQPLHRVARRRLRETAEFVADGFAVRLTRRPDDLVAGLMALGRRSTFELAPAFASDSLLVRRAERALGGPIDRGTGSAWLLAGFAIGLVAFAWLSPAVVPAYDCRITGAVPDVASWFLLHL